MGCEARGVRGAKRAKGVRSLTFIQFFSLNSNLLLFLYSKPYFFNFYFEGDCDPPVLHHFGIRASGFNVLQYFLLYFHLQPGSAMTYQCCCHNHHFGPIEMLRERSPHSTGLSFSHPGELMRTSPVLRRLYILVYFL